ncbi:MAG: hypothetical protein V3T31_05450, partial [candidate division Zixibacteria bacterium]
YVALREFATSRNLAEGDAAFALAGSFDERICLKFNHADYGQILAGLSHGNLVGLAGYKKSSYDAWLSDWLITRNDSTMPID